MLVSTVAPTTPLAYTDPVSYRGDEVVQRDLANLRSALDGLPAQEAFMPSVSPTGTNILGVNQESNGAMLLYNYA